MKPSETLEVKVEIRFCSLWLLEGQLGLCPRDGINLALFSLSTTIYQYLVVTFKGKSKHSPAYYLLKSSKLKLITDRVFGVVHNRV